MPLFNSDYNSLGSNSITVTHDAWSLPFHAVFIGWGEAKQRFHYQYPSTKRHKICIHSKMLQEYYKYIAITISKCQPLPFKHKFGILQKYSLIEQ